MIIWPEKELTKKVLGSYTPVVLAAVVYMWLTYECFQNPTSLQGFASGITNLPGLTKGFGEEVSVATAWSHFLAEDLFIVSVGRVSHRVSNRVVACSCLRSCTASFEASSASLRMRYLHPS